MNLNTVNAMAAFGELLLMVVIAVGCVLFLSMLFLALESAVRARRSQLRINRLPRCSNPPEVAVPAPVVRLADYRRRLAASAQPRDLRF